MQLDKDTTFITGETNLLIWQNIAFDPSIELEILLSKKIDTIYITHGHCDHFRLAAKLKNAGAKIVAPRKEAFFIENPQLHVRAMFSWANLPPQMVTRFFQGDACAVDAFTEDISEKSIKPINLPGHSVDHHGFLLENGILVAGDALWPFVLWNRTPLPYAVDIDQVRKSLDSIAHLDFDILVPGHGPVLSHEEADINIKHHKAKLDEIDGLILNLLKTPMNVEKLTELLSIKLGLMDRMNRYWLTIVLVKAFLCSLNQRKLVAYNYENYRMLWYVNQ